MAQKYSPVVRWLLYIVSFLNPLIGVIVGVILMTRDDQESRDVGKNCIIAAVVSLVLWALGVSIVFVVSFVLSFGFNFVFTTPTPSMLLLPIA